MSGWRASLGALALVAAALLALTHRAWAAMAHQWWAIDTYSHILLIPLVIAWLVWLRRPELGRVTPQGWWPGAVLTALALLLWLMGERGGINTLAQLGAVGAVQGAVLALSGLRAGLVIAFPLAYAVLLVPMGGELIPALQHMTARLVTGLLTLSGVPFAASGIHIDTPAGRFNIAEECAGVKFLIAMLALGILVSYARLVSWRRRAALMLACVVVPILANAVRAWATIAVAQRVGAERAGGIDHLIYGWVFFALVVALVLGVAWRWFEREPEEAGLAADWIDRRPALLRMERLSVPLGALCGALGAVVACFAALAQLG